MPSRDAWNTRSDLDPASQRGARQWRYRPSLVNGVTTRVSINGWMLKRYPLATLVLANLVPISGALLLKWDLFSVLFYYWLESAVVGAYNIPRMLMISPVRRDAARVPIAARSHKTSGIIFFAVHYSGFMVGHWFAIYSLFDAVQISLTTVAMGIVSLSISHGVSFFVNYIGHKEYEKVTVSQQMVAPYRRIVVMHVAVILCAFLLSLLGLPRVVLTILVLLKIVIDVVFHLREHRRLGTYAGNQVSGQAAGESDG
jgi:hypothetical protein